MYNICIDLLILKTCYIFNVQIYFDADDNKF